MSRIALHGFALACALVLGGPAAEAFPELAASGRPAGSAPSAQSAAPARSGAANVPSGVRELAQVQVAFRGFVIVEPRADAFHFEVLLQALNVGAVTWLVDDVTFELPARYEGFSSKPGSSLTCAPADGRRVRLSGSVPAGQHEVSFSFRVPSRGRSAESFHFTLPPRVAELRVLAEAGKGMRLRVPGFPEASRSRTPDGQPLLVTHHAFSSSTTPLESITVELSGIPTTGAGRYVALVLALGLMLGGGLVAARGPRAPRGKRKGRPSDRRQPLLDARARLLEEAVALHRARDQGDLGPVAFDTARRALVDAIARLELARTTSGRATPDRTQPNRSKDTGQ